MKPSYDTLKVTFSDPIKVLDGIFEDAAEWGNDREAYAGYTVFHICEKP